MRTARRPRSAPGSSAAAALALALPLCLACAIFPGAGPEAARAPAGGPPAAPAAPSLTGAGATAEPRPVLQLAYGGGLGNVPLGPPGGPDLITSLTLWDDGRAVFRPSRGVYQEARLAREAVARMLAAAADLYALEDFYAASGASDAASSVLSLETARGRKTVEAYAMHPYTAPIWEGSRTELTRLRAVWRAAVGELPLDAPALAPDELIVSLDPGIGRSYPWDHSCATFGITEEWPPALVGRVTGESARQAAALAPIGPRAGFCVDGAIQRVTLRPVLPSLSAPGRNWPYGGLPRHPAATAYDTGEYYTYLYRAPGVPQVELADWYRTQMDLRGWRLMHETVNTRQIWVRPRRYEPAPLVELRFAPGGLEMRYVSLGPGFPVPSDGVAGPCGGPECLRLPQPPDAVAAWFREYLGFTGWTEIASNLYQLESALLHLELRPENGGTAVDITRSQATSPPPGVQVPHPQTPQIAVATPMATATPAP